MQKHGVPNSKLPLLEWLLANGETPALFTESSSAHEADDGHYLQGEQPGDAEFAAGSVASSAVAWSGGAADCTRAVSYTHLTLPTICSV